MIIITDPRTLYPLTSPFLVLANSKGNFVSDAIDLRTDLGGYHPVDHAMSCIHQGKFCSQGLTFVEEPMDGYMKPGAWLAFVTLVNANNNFNVAFHLAIEKHLALPWWQRFYNFVEIAGQAIDVADLSFPGLFDCSMIDVKFLKDCAQYLPQADQAVINSLSNFINPEQLWKAINDNPGVFNVYGIYDASQGGLTV